MARRAEAIRAGTWQPFVPDATPARARVALLRDAGYSMPAIAAATGVAESSLESLLRSPARKITPETEQRIHAANLDPRHLPPTVLVAPHGTRRRIDALAVHGWDYSALDREGRLASGKVANAYKAPHPTAATAALIADLYDRLWAMEGPSVRSRSRALKAGKHDDWGDDIDDPAATPNQATPVRAMDEALFAVRTGRSVPEAARACGLDPESIIAAARRIGKRTGDWSLHQLLTRAREEEADALRPRQKDAS